jgi:phage tail-like protein
VSPPRPGEPGFLYLNRDDAWLDFQRHDLEIAGGQLMLSSLPALSPPLQLDDPALQSPDQPAGIAVGPDGARYLTNGWQAAVARVDPCDGSVSLVPAIHGEGDEPGQLVEPAGLAYHPRRRALIVADADNGRLQFVELPSFQVIDVWIGFDRPVDIAVDQGGRVYVVDRGTRRIEVLTASGTPVPDFWTQLSADLAGEVADLIDPVNIAVAPDGTVAVLDRGAGRAVIAGPDGHLHDLSNLQLAGDAMGLAITADALFVGENDAAGCVIKFRRDGTRVGACAGYEGPVAGLAIDTRGGLLVNPGWLEAPLSFGTGGAHAPLGYALGGPFGGFAGWNKRWHALAARLGPLPADTHVTFAVQTTDTPDPPPVTDPPDPLTGYFSPDDWQLGPLDLERFLIRLPERRYAWVGIQLESEGAGSPAIEQIRLDYDVPSYLEHLPEIYRDEDEDDALLARYLAMVASLFDDVEAGIDRLPALVDPAGTSRAWLYKLARWLGLDISPRWSEAELRDAITHAYGDAARRGTVAGLLAAIRRYAGMEPIIEEPIIQAGWWALAERESPAAERETSLLGVSTVLVAAEPAGAVLGATATVGRSHLIPGEQFGSPLFDGLAHRVMVRIDGNLAPERQGELDALIEREKPAHVLHELCPVKPGVSVGRVRVGFDAIVSGTAPPATFGERAQLGIDTVLGGEPSIALGDDSELGISTRLRDERP